MFFNGSLGNKIDNGFVSFDNVTLPKNALLNRFQDIDEQGNYFSKIADPNKRFALTLGSLSGGRVGITDSACTYMKIALTISIRYSCSRRQFGEPSKKEEQQIWEYQMQRYRLLPYLASTYCLHFFSKWLIQKFSEVSEKSERGDIDDNFLQMNAEMHAVSCGAKPLATWLSRDTVQESRQCCGGILSILSLFSECVKNLFCLGRTWSEFVQWTWDIEGKRGPFPHLRRGQQRAHPTAGEVSLEMHPEEAEWKERGESLWHSLLLGEGHSRVPLCRR